ncbi:hypothetical protein JCM10207_006230 [Rhodosporidiobolus poonsookiae]
MPPTDPSVQTGQLARKSAKPLDVLYHINSEAGLSSITSLIIGAEAAVLIDPPFLVPDAEDVVAWIKEKTTLPLAAVFVTHHHPDHHLSSVVVLDAFPDAKYFAAPYVLAGIEREWGGADGGKPGYWRKIYGPQVPDLPVKPDSYPFSFFILPGNTNSPVILLGPVQGDTVDHSMFYLPREKVIITGDCVYSRSTQVWGAEIETPHLLSAWMNIVDLIEGLDVQTIIPGHKESGSALELDNEADLAYMRKYLNLFAEKITYAAKKPSMDEVKTTFRDAFPDADKNHAFFLGKLADCFGEGGPGWEENAHHSVEKRRVDDLEQYVMGNDAKLKQARGQK